MRNVVTLVLATAVVVVAGTAMASPAARPNAAVQAYRQAVRQDCETGVFVPSELDRLYRAARASGYRGYLRAPAAAAEACVQAP